MKTQVKTKKEAGFYDCSLYNESDFCRGCPAGEMEGRGGKCIRDKSRTCWLGK